MNLHKIFHVAIAIAMLGRFVPSAPMDAKPRSGSRLHPILSEHPPSPFKMPKAGQEAPKST